MNRSFLIAVLVMSLTLVSGLNHVLISVANKNEALAINPRAEITSCIERELEPVKGVFSTTSPKDNLIYYLGEKQEDKSSILKCLLGDMVFSYVALPIKITKEELNLSTPSLLAFQSKSQCNLNLHFQVFRIWSIVLSGFLANQNWFLYFQ